MNARRTYTKTFPGGNGKPGRSTFTVTTGRFSVATKASSTRLRGTDTLVRPALFPDRVARRIGRELEADGWTLQEDGS